MNCLQDPPQHTGPHRNIQVPSKDDSKKQRATSAASTASSASTAFWNFPRSHPQNMIHVLNFPETRLVIWWSQSLSRASSGYSWVPAKVTYTYVYCIPFAHATTMCQISSCTRWTKHRNRCSNQTGIIQPLSKSKPQPREPQTVQPGKFLVFPEMYWPTRRHPLHRDVGSHPSNWIQLVTCSHEAFTTCPKCCFLIDATKICCWSPVFKPVWIRKDSTPMGTLNTPVGSVQKRWKRTCNQSCALRCSPLGQAGSFQGIMP